MAVPGFERRIPYIKVGRLLRFEPRAIFYTNFGHAVQEWDFPEFQQMLLLQGIRWSGGRLSADCAPTTDRTGRLQASWSTFDGAKVATSSEAGAQATLTEIVSGGWVAFDNVDLTGADALDVHASPETEPLSYSGTQPPFTPASGGVITAHLDDSHGPVIGTVAVQGPPVWSTQQIPLSGLTGIHRIVLTFDSGSTASSGPLFSVAWIKVQRPS